MSEFTWRNKWLTSEARTIHEMIEMLEAAARELREMIAAGVVLDEASAMADDYARLTTTDPKVAKRFGFVKVAE